jgi:hypothetical protein
MAHPESVTAVLTDNEPPNGTKLIIGNGSDWTIIQRDDKAAALRGVHPGDRWFEGDYDGDPMSLHEHLKYADAVYALGEPLAVFNR